jgi:thioredoxin reductase
VDGFTVTTADGASYRGRRILLATGGADELPLIEGLAERWGQSVVARAAHSLSLAVGNGALAEIRLHRALFWPESPNSLQDVASAR